MTETNAGDEKNPDAAERAEEQGGYGSPTPEEEMGPRAGQDAESREDEGLDPTEQDGRSGEPTD